MMTILTVLTVVVLFVLWKGSTGTETPEANAQTILAERFAKGEIDEETYQRIRQSFK
jgi:uncharacterized membrane protein